VTETASDRPTAADCLCCGTQLTGLFCAACGQRAGPQRLELRTLLTHFVSAFTNFEGPLLRTSLGLLVRPHIVVGDYLRGRRIVYTNPVQWAILTSGTSALIGHVLGRVGPVQIKVDGSTPEWLRRVIEQLGSNSSPLYVLVLLPGLAVAMRIAFGRRGGTIPEHLVVVLYGYGIGALLQLVWAGAVAWFGAPPGPAGLLPMVFTAWGAVGAQPTRSKVASVLRTLLAHCLWALLLLALGLVVFGICWLLGLIG
jgi:hypothetical protein